MFTKSTYTQEEESLESTAFQEIIDNGGVNLRDSLSVFNALGVKEYFDSIISDMKYGHGDHKVLKIRLDNLKLLVMIVANSGKLVNSKGSGVVRSGNIVQISGIGD